MKAKFQDPRIAQKVLEMVATYYRTTPEALKDKGGDPIARKVVIYTLKEELGASLKASLKAVGKKYPSEVYQAVKRIRGLMKTDTALASMIEAIKIETLMIATMLDGSTSVSPGPATPPQQQKPLSQLVSVVSRKTKETQITPSSNTAQIIANVQIAVTRVFLGVGLLQSRDPASEVILARDAVVFLVWDDFPGIPHSEIFNAFHLDQDGFHRAIGRITVCMREDGNKLKDMLEVARNTYQ